MKYYDGKDIRLGDKVRLSEDTGIIVAVITDNLYMEGYNSFDYLKNGFLADFKKYGLLYYDEAEEDIELLERDKDMV